MNSQKIDTVLPSLIRLNLKACSSLEFFNFIRSLNISYEMNA